MLSSFQWYRKMRGGRWAKVTGLMWGKRWVHLSPECVERDDENWEKGSSLREQDEQAYRRTLQARPEWTPTPRFVFRDGGCVVEPRERIAWPDPTPEMLNTPEFDAVWSCIKDWDIAVPAAYGGYCGANGNHVRAILDALKRAKVHV